MAQTLKMIEWISMDIYGYLHHTEPRGVLMSVEVWHILATFRWFGIPKFPTPSSLSIDGGRKECPMVANAFWWWLPCLSPRIPAEGFQRLKACVASEGVLVEVFCTLVETWTLGACLPVDLLVNCQKTQAIALFCLCLVPVVILHSVYNSLT